jgi:hypothetical protein
MKLERLAIKWSKLGDGIERLLDATDPVVKQIGGGWPTVFQGLALDLLRAVGRMEGFVADGLPLPDGPARVEFRADPSAGGRRSHAAGAARSAASQSPTARQAKRAQGANKRKQEVQ